MMLESNTAFVVTLIDSFIDTLGPARGGLIMKQSRNSAQCRRLILVVVLRFHQRVAKACILFSHLRNP